MSIVVEILAVSVAIIGLQDNQLAGTAQFFTQRRENPCKVLLREMLEQVAGKCEIDGILCKEAKVDDVPAHYKGKTIRVTGTVKLYREKPEIIVNDPEAQIKFVEKK